MIPAYLLTDTVVVERFVAGVTPDEYGITQGAWTKVAELKARVEDVSDRIFKDDRWVKVTSKRAFVAGAANVEEGDRILFQGKRYEVTSVLERRMPGGARSFRKIEMASAA